MYTVILVVHILTKLKKVLEIETNNHLWFGKLEKYRQHLIDEYWYKENQLEIISDYLTSSIDKVFSKKVGITPATGRILGKYKRLQGTRYLKRI